MGESNTLEQDLDRVLGGLSDAEPVGEWDWEPPLGSTAPGAAASADPEGSDEPTEPEESE